MIIWNSNKREIEKEKQFSFIYHSQEIIINHVSEERTRASRSTTPNSSSFLFVFSFLFYIYLISDMITINLMAQSVQDLLE